jgi:hypothetical protein
MTTFQAALVKEQGITFVVVSVRDSVISDHEEANRLIGAMQLHFHCPAVLMGADRHQLYGRRDIVEFLSHVHPSRLPWREWSIAA